MLSALAVAPADEGPGAGVLHLYSHAFFKALLFLAIGWLSVTVGGTAAADDARWPARAPVHPAGHVRRAAVAGRGAAAGRVRLQGARARRRRGRRGDGQARAWLVLLAGLAHRRPHRGLLHARLDRPRRPRLAPTSSGTTPTPPPSGVRAAVTVLRRPDRRRRPRRAAPRCSTSAVTSAWLVALLSVLLIVGAGLAVRSVAAGEDPAVRVVGARMPSFDAGFGVDRLYVTLVARPVLALAHVVVFLDREVVDAYVRGAAAAARLGGAGGERAHRVRARRLRPGLGRRRSRRRRPRGGGAVVILR